MARTPKLGFHRPTGQYRVQINGKSHYLGADTGDAQVQYHALLADWMAGRQLAPPKARVMADGITVVEAVALFLTDARARLTVKACARYQLAGRSLTVFAGHKQAADLEPVDLRRIREMWVREGRSRSAVNRLMVAVKSIIKWGAIEGHIPTEVQARLALLPGLRRGELGVKERVRRHALSLTVIRDTLEHLPPQLADFIRLNLYTACRPSELCGMRPRDIVVSDGLWWFTPESHKTEAHGVIRRIPLIAPAREIVKTYLDGRPLEACVFSPAETIQWYRDRRRRERKTPAGTGTEAGDRCTTDPKWSAGDRFTTDTIAQAIGYACRRAWPAPMEIRDDPEATKKWNQEHRWTPGLLRHTAAQVIRDECGLEAAALVCGHKASTTTEAHYASEDATRAAAHLERVAGQLKLA